MRCAIRVARAVRAPASSSSCGGWPNRPAGPSPSGAAGSSACRVHLRALATLAYVIVAPGGLDTADWLLVGLGLVLDVMTWVGAHTAIAIGCRATPADRSVARDEEDPGSRPGPRLWG